MVAPIQGLPLPVELDSGRVLQRGRAGPPPADPGAEGERPCVRHYNQQRPHRSLALAGPEAAERQSSQVNPREVRRRDVFGGLIHEFHKVAA
jgi:hypothetical protein